MIKNEQALRRAYMKLNNKETATAELKQEIREYNRKEVGYEKIIHKSKKSIITLVKFPSNVRTKKQADNAFKRNYIQRGFDNIFSTTSYRLFKRNKKWFAYHIMVVTF